ncbi:MULTISPECIES: DUF4424 family protein [unclassified Duganella]|jgi:hypothetical protein|uniref:DUF4424 family protein n=1 Tax=unclassified Duganella TaxID=2636909 RepID=UPI00088D57DC|nr:MULTISPECIES: DUF4424 family protein [unclassified Duganella]SDH15255.1 protein of unknown function [Duganella sp. OV458]SDK29766.1 protein of unknown function [Duganella sp. OV510]
MKITLTATLLLPLLASANDGIGGVSAGGIVFGKTDAIAMKKEVLTVSHRLISVDYEFVNESAQDVVESIVFPLPEYAATNLPSDTYYGQPGNFSISVDGKPVGFRTVVRAMLDEVDVTAQLHGVGISDAQIAHHERFAPDTKVQALTASQRQQLISLKLIGPGPSDDLEPLWNIQVNYVWQQKFPPNKLVRVHHAYRPFVSAGPAHSGMDDETARHYCADAGFIKGWQRLAARNSPAGSGYLSLNAAKVSYILKTGNTWKNGIEDFTLNIVKQSPDELVSLCFPGNFKKINASTFQVRLRNFRPSADLEVYFGNIDPNGEPNDGQMPRMN